MRKILLVLILALLAVSTSAADCLPNCKTCNALDATICDECNLDHFASADKKSCLLLEYPKQSEWPGVCSTGTKQSPINILTKDVKMCPPKKQFYNVFSGQSTNINPAGQSLKAAYASQSTIEYVMADSKLRIYNSAQFHWHSPAEHQLDSKVFDLQLHVVHTVVDAGVTKYGVAGFFFKVDLNVHTDIFDRYDFMPGNPRPFAFPIDVRNRLVYHYQGSLTTPPCTQQVDFFLYADYIPITLRNFQKMKEVVAQGHTNARPVKDLNGRTVDLMGSFCNAYNQIPTPAAAPAH